MRDENLGEKRGGKRVKERNKRERKGDNMDVKGGGGERERITDRKKETNNEKQWLGKEKNPVTTI